jgi:hypothetical protein
VDVRGIEDYPLPFQPHVPQPAEESASPAPAMPPLPAPPRTEDPAPERRPPAPVEAAAPPAPAREVSPPVREERSVEPPPAPPSRPSPPPVESRRPLTEGDDAVRVRPAEPAGMVEPPPSRPAEDTVPPYRSRPAEAPEPHRARPAVERRRPERRRHVELAEVTAQLAPLVGPLEIGQRYQAGVTLVTAAASSVDPEAATATAVPYIPFLADPRLPQPVSQATVRAGSGSLVLTPLGPLERGGTVLLTAVPPGAPLAMVERASLRAVDDQDAPDETSPAVRSADGAGDPDLRMAAVPPHVRAVADSLRAFGQVTPAVLRDHAGTLLMYLFLSPDVDARLIAGFARDLRRNFTGAPLGAVSSVIARVGVYRVVVWELDAGRSCASVLVACGPVDRPGLARIELERAALRLAAL